MTTTLVCYLIAAVLGTAGPDAAAPPAAQQSVQPAGEGFLTAAGEMAKAAAAAATPAANAPAQAESLWDWLLRRAAPEAATNPDRPGERR